MKYVWVLYLLHAWVNDAGIGVELRKVENIFTTPAACAAELRTKPGPILLNPNRPETGQELYRCVKTGVLN